MKSGPLIYDKAMHEARTYWRQVLEGVTFQRYLALDRPISNTSKRDDNCVTYILEQDVSDALIRTTSGNAILGYTVLLSALRICCHIYSGQFTTIVFSPSLRGESPNILPIVGTLNDHASFKDVLRETQTLLSGGYKHQQYPFNRMLGDGVHRPGSEHTSVVASLNGVHNEALDRRYDLKIDFDVQKSDRHIASNFTFDRHTHSPQSVEHFYSTFRQILTQGLSKVDIDLAQLRTYCTQHRSTESISQDADSNANIGTARIESLISSQASQHPTKIAIRQGKRTLSFEELERQASQLASLLTGIPMTHRPVVAIVMETSIESVVCILASLKAGYAFTPLSLRLSDCLAERLSTLDPSYVICHTQDQDTICRALATIASKFSVVSLEYSSSGDLATHVAPTPPPADSSPNQMTRPENAVCVTVVGSSSVTVDHTELVQSLEWVNQRHKVQQTDSCLVLTSAETCQHLYSVLGSLLAGAQVEIVETAQADDPRVMIERLGSSEITVWNFTTTWLQNLLPYFEAEDCTLKDPHVILVNGEQQSGSLLRAIARRFPRTRISGLYAHPHIGIWSTIFDAQDHTSESTAAAQGRPIFGFQHFVVHPNGALVPTGVKGELMIRHHLGSTEMTVETGLRAAPLDSGKLLWLGRDTDWYEKYACQVELYSIEAALCRNDHVFAAEVTAVAERDSDETRVIAFALADPEHVSAQDLRDRLIADEDVVLIPDQIILVSRFPLTAEGDLDREALLADLSSSHMQPKHRPQGMDTETILERLNDMWTELLGIENPGAKDSFFAQGGNSLKATLLLARVQDVFDVELSVQEFFRTPTPEAVAGLIAQAQLESETSPETQLRAMSREKYRVQLSALES